MNIYVGNIPYAATEEGLRELFAEFGDVVSASIVIDRETGRSRGFAFVRMADRAAGERAMVELNGAEWLGRAITCNEARARESGPMPRSEGTGPGPRRERPAGASDAPRESRSAPRTDSDARRPSPGGRRSDPPRRDREEERARERRKRMNEGKERRSNNKDWSQYVDGDDDEG